MSDHANTLREFIDTCECPEWMNSSAKALIALDDLVAKKDAEIDRLRKLEAFHAQDNANLADELREARAEIERLRAIIEGMSKTRQETVDRAVAGHWKPQLDETRAQVRTLTEALQKIAGPHDDSVMKQARTLHYDMAWWAQQALAAAQEPPAEGGDRV